MLNYIILFKLCNKTLRLLLLLACLLRAGFPGSSVVKKLPAMQETGFDPWVEKILWRREWLPTPVFCPEEFHQERSLVGNSPWGCKESDKT